MRSRGWKTAAAWTLLAGCTTHHEVTIETGGAEPARPTPAEPAAGTPAEPASPPNPWVDRELPFEPSDDDRPFLGTGFTGYHAVPEKTGYTQGVRVAGVQKGQALDVAGLQDGDVIVAFAGQTLDGPKAELIQQLRDILKNMEPDTLTSLAYWRKDEGVKEIELWIGRGAPEFARLSTPDHWFEPTLLRVSMRDPEIDAWIDAALALDDGEERAQDTRRRQRDRFEKCDVFRLPMTVRAQLNPAAQERLAAAIVDDAGVNHHRAARLATDAWRPGINLDVRVEPVQASDWEQLLDEIERQASIPGTLEKQLADWTDEERTWLADNVHQLTERALVEGDYLYGDEDVGRERTNRRICALLARVDRSLLASLTEKVAYHVEGWLEASARLAEADGRDGLLASRDTKAGRIEIWGGGSQTHKTRCFFRYDHAGDDRYLDVGGRADLEQRVSVNVDRAGDDVYGATSPFCQGAALGGIGLLIDVSGDDQYLARQWSQGAAIAGAGILDDRGGDDTYRGREACQGAALVGGGELHDESGDDAYSADRFSQGVGFAAGVGVIRDAAGDDRYSCTGRYGSEYGEDGLFSGWGQGVGFGFRRVTSGGIGVLHDVAGDDVYEAGNFSQGGAYFFAWGIFRDDAGDDRYIGSRYAQGYAAHQAAGTFVDGGGDDVYQSYSTVAQGLSWDETSVFFRDRGGDDRYQTGGFSLASAAHNAMVIFIDDAGDDVYAELPSKAQSNNYHGGWSFALFVDRAGDDRYGKKAPADWNARAWWRHDGAYFLDLDGDRPLTDLVREPAKRD
jgi:hypothetical protein